MAKAPQDVSSRAAKLRELIEHHRHLYHTHDKPEISDTAYDSLVKELEDIETAHPELLMPDSPTQRIGGKPLSKFHKVRHQVRQWSFDDVFSFEELKKWEFEPLPPDAPMQAQWGTITIKFENR